MARLAGSRPDDTLDPGRDPAGAGAALGREQPGDPVPRRRPPVLLRVPRPLRRLLRRVRPRPAGGRGGARPGPGDGPSPWPSRSTRPAARATARRSRTGGASAAGRRTPTWPSRSTPPSSGAGSSSGSGPLPRRRLPSARSSRDGADGSPTDGGFAAPWIATTVVGDGGAMSVRGPLENGACVNGNDETRSGAPSGGRRRVLVADDSESYRRIARGQLSARGLEVVTVATGAEALDRLAAEPFDLLLVDGMMPRLDGPATAREIRRREVGGRGAAHPDRRHHGQRPARGPAPDAPGRHRRPGGQAAARRRARPGARSMAALARHPARDRDPGGRRAHAAPPPATLRGVGRRRAMAPSSTRRRSSGWRCSATRPSSSGWSGSSCPTRRDACRRSRRPRRPATSRGSGSRSTPSSRSRRRSGPRSSGGTPTSWATRCASTIRRRRRPTARMTSMGLADDLEATRDRLHDLLGAMRAGAR